MNPQLKELRLNQNPINLLSVQYLINGLQTNTNLEFISVDNPNLQGNDEFETKVYELMEMVELPNRQARYQRLHPPVGTFTKSATKR